MQKVRVLSVFYQVRKIWFLYQVFGAVQAFQIFLDKVTLFHGKAPGFQFLYYLTFSSAHHLS